MDSFSKIGTFFFRFAYFDVILCLGPRIDVACAYYCEVISVIGEFFFLSFPETFIKTILLYLFPRIVSFFEEKNVKNLYF